MSFFRLLLSVVMLGAACCVGSCVVSNEIEFYEKINMPPLLDTADPATDNVRIEQNNSERDFTVTVWDPDEDDGSLYEGYVTVIEQINSSNANYDATFCSDVVPSKPDPEKHEGGVMVKLTCTATFNLNIPDVSAVIVEVEVSDRGFLPGGELRDGANSLPVQWTVELYPEESSN